MTRWRRADDRAVIEIAGRDAESFLQGLLSNDMRKAAADRIVYALLLTPQGKHLVDVFLTRPAPERFLADVAAEQAAFFVQRLGMYKLRAQVAIAPASALAVFQLWPAPEAAVDGALLDPRAAALGLRLVTDAPEAVAAALGARFGPPATAEAYALAQIETGAPASLADLAPNESFPLELGLDALAAIDFRKGCYVGQEVTARMKHKGGEAKKGLLRVRVTGAPPPPGTEVTAGEKTAGRLGATAPDGAGGAIGLALLRLDRLADGPLWAGAAPLEVVEGP